MNDVVSTSAASPAHAHAQPLDGQQLFAHWLLTCGHNPWEPLTPEAAKPYGFIWQSWLRFLQQEDGLDPQAWSRAQAVQVLRFINHGPQSPKHSQPSDITRRRYWRVLDRIYAHAVVHGWMAHNPAQGIAPQELPPSEDPKGAILSTAMWRALQRHLPAPEDLISCRDRTVLMLLMELGLTPEEVRHLEVADLHYATTGEPRIEAVQVRGERERQTRTLPVSPPLASALQQWLLARAGYHAMQGQPALFCTRKAPQLSNHTLLHLVTKTLKAAAQAAGLPEPARLGPQVLRNTVLVQWLDSGLSVQEVLERAGMKQPHALLHLRHFMNPEVHLPLPDTMGV